MMIFRTGALERLIAVTIAAIFENEYTNGLGGKGSRSGWRRVDDDFVDPITFRADSTLGVADPFNVVRAGNVAIANAPGTGIADDKAVGESSGYGMLIGPHAAKQDIAAFRERLKANPENYISQPTLALSRDQ